MVSHRVILRTVSTLLAIALAGVATSASAQVESTPELTPAPAAPAAAPEPEAEPMPEAAAPAARPTMAPARPDRESYWYGWQTLTADGLSVATMFAGAALHSEGVAWFGVGGYFLGAPVVHVVQGRVGAGFGSLGLRVGAPVVGAIIGYAAAGPCSSSENAQLFGCVFHGWGEAIIGGLIGATGAVALDAALLAHGTRQVAPPQETGIPKLTSIAPSFDPRTRTTSLGASGTF